MLSAEPFVDLKDFPEAFRLSADPQMIRRKRKGRILMPI